MSEQRTAAIFLKNPNPAIQSLKRVWVNKHYMTSNNSLVN